jgi:Metallopeptidase toxin 2
MGNILKGLSEILSGNGSIIDALTGSQAGSDSNIFNLSERTGESSSPGKQGSCHVFSEDGRFLRAENKQYTPSDSNRGTNIYIENATKDSNGKETKSLVLLTSYPMPTAETTTGLAKIIQMYASKLNIPIGENENKVGINAGKGMMFTLGTNIYANSAGGKLSPFLPDYYNVQNALIHEYNHRLNNVKGVKDSDGAESFEHAKVYLEQIKHPTFKKATIEFQAGVLTNLCNVYLTSAIVDAGLQDNIIQKFVDSVNVVLKSYKSELNFYFEVFFKPPVLNPNDFSFSISRKT